MADVTQAGRRAGAGSAVFETAGRTQVDNVLSRRELVMDPRGFAVVAIDQAAGELVVRWFDAVVDERNVVCDPETGKAIPAGGRLPFREACEYRATSAKQMCIRLFETGTPSVSMLSHAAYLGRELVFAELALREGRPYVQD
jgi:hypothetical protein